MSFKLDVFFDCKMGYRDVVFILCHYKTIWPNSLISFDLICMLHLQERELNSTYQYQLKLLIVGPFWSFRWSNKWNDYCTTLSKKTSHSYFWTTEANPCREKIGNNSFARINDKWYRKWKKIFGYSLPYRHMILVEKKNMIHCISVR